MMKKVERIVDPEKIDSFYANCSMINSTTYDFSMLFGKVFVEGDVLKEKYEKAVYMSPQQAKAFCIGLQTQITSYEGAFGEITISPKEKK